MSITSPIRRLGESFATVSEKYFPNPYVLAILLTALAFIGALGVGASPGGAFDAWVGGVWTFLTFMAAFSVTLMAGDAIAKSPTGTKFLQGIASIPNSRFTAVAFVSFASMVAGLISWAIGLIAGAVLAKQVAYQGKRRGLKLHYPLLIAAGYTALMIWHSGITSSSALIMADPSLIADSFPEYVQNGIPVTQTIGSTVNIVTVILLVAVIPLIMGVLHPEDPSKITEIPDQVVAEMTFDDSNSDSSNADSSLTDGGQTVENPATATQEADATGKRAESTTIADRLNRSPILGVGMAIFFGYFCINAWVLEGSGFASLTLNSINAFFLFFAMILWKTPMGIVDQMQESVESVGQILFQYPFYAGIAGLLTGTGLAEVIAHAFASVSSPLTWPVFGLMYAGLVNIFIPSGGGQWIAQGPILLEITNELGMPAYTAVLVEMMGDQLTNMVQPFFALPVLALADLRARDIIGYTAVAMVAGFIIMATTMTYFLGM